MSSNHDQVQLQPTVIEIVDSSDGSDNEQPPAIGNKISPRTKPSTVDESTRVSDITRTTQPEELAPKKLHNRRKSVHHSIRSMEDLTFESVFTRNKRTHSEEDVRGMSKKGLDEKNIDAVIYSQPEDPEMTRCLRKIAYCRVLTNYLLRQYNMMEIDFKLYSNIDMLMVELKKRVDTYTAIKRSRQRLHLAGGSNGNV